MSNEKFIIGIKNPEPAEPEFQYFCGPKAPITTLSACIDSHETVWDEDPATAEVFRSLDITAFSYELLSVLFPNDNFFVMRRIVTYEPVDTQNFIKIIQNNKINNILKRLDKKDVEYLQDRGVLDLTIVT